MNALPARLQGLLRPAAYPHPVEAVEVIETQLSWVLLTGERAYKIKRPVVYPFADFSRLDDRRHFCQEELRLNRRFAPALYLDVCAITGQGAEARIDGDGPEVEYAVVMRAFDRREELDRLVRDQRISVPELEDFGRRLARLHAEVPTLPPGRDAGQPTAVATALARNASECAALSTVFGTEERIIASGAALAREADARTPALAWRAQSGTIRECHADLHLSNVVRIDGKLLPFDCLEFEPAFRWIDVAQDIAFFDADMRGYGEPRLADAFLNAYLAESGDYHACTVLPLYVADRALVRAKVMALLATNAKDRGSNELDLLSHRHLGYLDVAERSLRATTPRCIMMTGLPGSGKSWLATRLAPALEAIHLRSDIERKRLAGIPAAGRSHSPPAGGLYTSARTVAVYERLERCAEEVLAGHRNVIVDANFGMRQQRATLARLCARLSVPLYVVECAAPALLLRQRIETRTSLANDASEADLSVLEAQLAQRQAIADDEQLTVISANTASVEVEASVLTALQPQLPMRRS